jgi:predicted RNase H-like HicB family nuclease
MRYTIVMEKAPANYAAYVPGLPGCIATGATVAEAEFLIREAVEFHVEGIKQMAFQSLPQPSRVRRRVGIVIRPSRIPQTLAICNNPITS